MGAMTRCLDVGHTANPKYAVDWTVVDGVTLKANCSTAFVPPFAN